MTKRIGTVETFASYIVLCLAMSGCSDALASAPNLASWNGVIIPGEVRSCCITLAESACGSVSSDVVVADSSGSPFVDGCTVGTPCTAYEIFPDGGVQVVIAGGKCTAD